MGTAFEDETGENSMNPMVVYEAEINAAEIEKKRDEERRSVHAMEGV